jgi:D-3-phosphoglycerate dehydrogenase
VKPTVFVPEPIAACGMALLEAACDCVAPWAEGRVPTDAEARELLRGADAVIVRLFEIGAADLERCPRLKVIAKHGVGVDNIDCDAATARGIPVVFTPKANANSVAEHTIGLMLALARNVVPASVALREGRFADRSQFIGIELAGRTLGIVGLGRIGSRVAEIAATGLGMKVCGYDPYVAPGAYSGPAEQVESLDELLAMADFLTLHVGLTAETRRLLDDRRLARVKPGCRVLNTSRGAVVDESALVRALEEGRIAGAALDVTPQEPLPEDHPLWHMRNVVITPHTAGGSPLRQDRVVDLFCRNLRRFRAGEPLESVIDKHKGY